MDLLERKRSMRADLKDVTLKHTVERSLPECFQLFDIIHKLTDEPETIYRIACEMIEDFSQDGCRYLEIRTTPRATSSMTAEDYIRRVIAAIDDCAARPLDITVKVLLSINRAMDSTQAHQVVELAKKFAGKYVVGIDLSGNPAVGEFDTWLLALQQAREHGLKLSIHFAEVNNKTECVRILQELKPDRIGHACCLDEELFKLLLARPVPLEVCLTSNVITKSVPCYDEHHFKQFFEAHYPLCICMIRVFSAHHLQRNINMPLVRFL